MITLLKNENNLVKAGNVSFTLIALGSSKAASLPDSAVKELNVPWQDLNPNPDLFAFLSWHTRISEFAGREDELKALQEWAVSEPKISVKFVTGEGGTGKSRLAAEFAEALQNDGWSAGFVKLNGDQKFPVSKKGVLIVIDYPEENRDNVAELLRDLSGLSNDSCHIRVLFLSRDPLGKWMNFFGDSHAINLVDTQPVHLGRLEPLPAHTLYRTLLENASTALNTCPLPLSEEALAEWLNQAPENSRALFILAAALHNAINPEDELVRYSGAEVVVKLVERELVRLRRIATAEFGRDNELVFPRLLVLSAIAGGLSPEQIQMLPLGFPDGVDVEAVLTRAGLLNNETVPAPTPDLIAAAFTVTVLAESGKKAPELLWAALGLNIEKGLKNIGRLSYDAAFNLGLKVDPSKWLVEAIAGKPERCISLLKGVSGDYVPFTLREIAIAVYETLLKDGKQFDDEVRASLLNNLANLQRAKNELGKAEASYGEALEIRRKLSEANPEAYLPYVATTLNNLGLLQSAKNELGKAEASYGEALGIYRKLSEANPEAYLPYVATTAVNLSIFYLQSKPDKEASLAYAKEAFLAAAPFVEVLPAAKHYASLALQVVQAWGEDVEGFIERAIKEMNG